MVHTYLLVTDIKIGDTVLIDNKPTLILGVYEEPEKRSGYNGRNVDSESRIRFSTYTPGPQFAERIFTSTVGLWRIDAEDGKVREPYASLREPKSRSQ